MIDPKLPLADNLKEIKRLLEATAPGKWSNGLNEFHTGVYCETGLVSICTGVDQTTIDNATWIAASKESCEYLMKLVEAYRSEAIQRCRLLDDCNSHVHDSSTNCVDSEVQKKMEENRGA